MRQFIRACMAAMVQPNKVLVETTLAKFGYPQCPLFVSATGWAVDCTALGSKVDDALMRVSWAEQDMTILQSERDGGVLDVLVVPINAYCKTLVCVDINISKHDDEPSCAVGMMAGVSGEPTIRQARNS